MAYLDLEQLAQCPPLLFRKCKLIIAVGASFWCKTGFFLWKTVFEPKSRGHPFKNEQRNTIYVNESGLYSLILRSKLESALAFKRWVTKDVLPSIRKTGRYDYGMNHKYNTV